MKSKRFTLTSFAKQDLAGLLSYLGSLPEAPAYQIGRRLRNTLESLHDNPRQGRHESEFSLLCGLEVRSRKSAPYRVYYQLDVRVPEVIAILHGAQDQASILKSRLT